MRIARPPHAWSVTAAQAIAIQKRLAHTIRPVAPKKPLRFIAGVDLAFTRDGRDCLAGVVLDCAIRYGCRSRHGGPTGWSRR